MARLGEVLDVGEVLALIGALAERREDRPHDTEREADHQDDAQGAGDPGKALAQGAHDSSDGPPRSHGAQRPRGRVEPRLRHGRFASTRCRAAARRASRRALGGAVGAGRTAGGALDGSRPVRRAGDRQDAAARRARGARLRAWLPDRPRARRGARDGAAVRAVARRAGDAPRGARPPAGRADHGRAGGRAGGAGAARRARAVAAFRTSATARTARSPSCSTGSPRRAR